MKKLFKLGLILVGSIALSFAMVNASENEAPKTMKCQSGKCDSGKCGNAGKDMKKEMNATKPAVKKSAPEKASGKCGVGKCS